MLMPDPDNERRLLSPSEFLASLENEGQRKKYDSLLKHLKPLANVVKARFPAPDGIPDLRIIKNARPEDTYLGDILNTIYLTDGLLEQCLLLDAQVSKTPHTPKTPQPLGALSVAKIGVMWAYAHELFHFLRRHALVEKHFGNDVSTKHALEYDADMCSVASVYRYIQYTIPNGDEFQSKRAVLMNLYWALRPRIERTSIEDFSGSKTHPYIAARLLDAVGKLAILNDTGIADPNFMHPISHLHHGKLFKSLCHLELAYVKTSQNPKNGETGFSLVAEFAIANSALCFTGHRARRWNEISQLIDSFAVLSRSMVDNEKSIAFMGENFSLPRSHPAA